jgi:hypothetical protein
MGLFAMKLLLASALLVMFLGGCGGGTSSAPQGSAPRDCLDEWNAPENAENRAVVSKDEDYRVAEVNLLSVSHPAEGLPGDGCAFLFHTDSRFISIDGLWAGKDLRWGTWLRGSWSEEQQEATQDNASVEDDGTLESR